MRICSSCKMGKNVDQFSERKESKDGLNKRCKICIAEAKRKWGIENKDKVVERRERNQLKKEGESGVRQIQNIVKTIKENTVGLKD